jgi:hypothetical protein
VLIWWMVKQSIYPSSQSGRKQAAVAGSQPGTVSDYAHWPKGGDHTIYLGEIQEAAAAAWRSAAAAGIAPQVGSFRSNLMAILKEKLTLAIRHTPDNTARIISRSSVRIRRVAPEKIQRISTFLSHLYGHSI